MAEPILASVAINLGSGLLQQGMALAGKHGYRSVVDVVRRGVPAENADALRATHRAYVSAMRVMAKAARTISTEPESRAAARALEALTDESAFSAFRWDGEHFPLEETHKAIDGMFAGSDGMRDGDLLLRYAEVVIRDLEVWGVTLTPPLRHLFLHGWERHEPWHAAFHTEFAEEVKTNQRAFRILTFEALTELRKSGVEIRGNIALLLEQGARMEGKIDSQGKVINETYDLVSTIADHFIAISQPAALDTAKVDGQDLGDPLATFARTATNPYRDLAYFDTEDACQFFGRDEEIRRALDQLSEILDDGVRPAGLAICGQTGSGKSSFLRAGVLSALGKTADRQYHIAIVRPDDFTIDQNFAARLLGTIAEQTDLRIPAKDLASCLKLNSTSIAKHICDALARALAQSGGKFVFAIDQFEEIVDFWAEGEEVHAGQRKFWSPLFDFIESFDSNRLGCVIYTLESNRRDIVARCRTGPIFDQSSVQQIDVDNESNGFFRQVIRKPFAEAGYHLSPDLVQSLLREIDAFKRHDVPGRPAVMPLLSLRLSRLYEHVERNFAPVAPANLNSQDPEADRSGYVRAADLAAGDARQLLASLGDEVSLLAKAAWARGTGNVKPTDEDLNILMPFIELTGNSMDLIRLNSVPRSSLKHHSKLLRNLVEARLVVERRGHFRLIHEAVIRNWPPATAWLERNATVLKEEATLRLRAQMWKMDGRPAIDGTDKKILQSAGTILAIHRSFWHRDQGDLEELDLLLKDYCIAVVHNLDDPRQMFDSLPGVGLAAIYGLGTTLERLLDIDPSAIEAKSNLSKATPIHYASWRYPEIVSLLISRGADLFTQDKDGWSVLSSAIWGQNETVFELILSAMGDRLPPGPFGTVLHECAAGGTAYMAQRLLAAELIDSNQKGTGGWLPIHFAANFGNLELFRLLGDLSDPFAQEDEGKQPIHFAAEAGHLQIVDEILDLPDAPQRIGSVDNIGLNCLHYAAYRQEAQVVERLAGVLDVNACGTKGLFEDSTALILAVTPNQFDRKASEPAILRTVQALLSSPATNPNLCDARNNTALSLSKDLPRVERTLLADDRLDLFCESRKIEAHPIQLAGNRGHMKILRAMLERASDTAPEGWSPIPYLVGIEKIDDDIIEMAFAKWPVSRDLAQWILNQGNPKNVKMTSSLLANVDRLVPEAIIGLWEIVAKSVPIDVVESFASKLERPWSTPYFGNWTLLHRLCAAQMKSQLEEYRPLYEKDKLAWQRQDAKGRRPADLLGPKIRESLLPGASLPPQPKAATSWDANCNWEPIGEADLEIFADAKLGFEKGPKTRIEETRLSFYPDSVRLVRIQDPGFSPKGAQLFWLVHKGQLYRLAGASLPIHQVNELGPIGLRDVDEEVAADYFRFFGFFVRGEDGPFLPFEAVQQTGYPKGLTEEERALLSPLPSSQVVEFCDDGIYRIMATIFYGSAVFGCDLEIATSGMPDMLREFPLTPDLSSVPDLPIELNS